MFSCRAAAFSGTTLIYCGVNGVQKKGDTQENQGRVNGSELGCSPSWNRKGWQAVLCELGVSLDLDVHTGQRCYRDRSQWWGLLEIRKQWSLGGSHD